MEEAPVDGETAPQRIDNHSAAPYSGEGVVDRTW